MSDQNDGPSYLEDLRRRLHEELKWQPDVPPEIGEGVKPGHLHEKAGRGFYGEDLMLRTLSERGEILLDAGCDPKDVYKGGPDAVTLGEDDAGEPVLKLYDNKAYSSQDKVSSVSALDRTLDDSIEDYRREWARLADPASGSTPAQCELFGKALDLLEAGRYERIVTNYNGRVTHLSDRLLDKGIRLEDMQGERGPPPELKPVFAEPAEADAAVERGPPPRLAPVFGQADAGGETTGSVASTPEVPPGPAHGSRLR